MASTVTCTSALRQSLSVMETTQLQQVHLGFSPHGPDSGGSIFAQEHKSLQAMLLGMCPAHLWHNDSYNAGCPRPILIGKHHQQQLERLHGSLTIAITDIVQRWWTDTDANFPRRMPLEEEEESLLQWLEVQASLGNLRPFPECLGSWRPDFLVEDLSWSRDGSIMEENFTITEINARFCFNGFMHEAYGQQALDQVLKDAHIRMDSATDPELILGGLFGLFQPNLPLHLLKGEENGIDIHMFIDIVERRFGIKPRLISPAQLRLVPDHQSKTGYRLCCVSIDRINGTASETRPKTFTYKDEILEEIHQVGLELHQRELVALELEMLRQLSLRCFNDMRTILLVHDKRMLGIVKQELQNMVARQVLSQEQADALDRGIVNTILPGSREMESLIQSCKDSVHLKNGYLLKPIRSGKGDGILFGEDFDPDDWVEALERLRSTRVVAGVTCVVQRRIHSRLYDVTLKPSGDTDRYPLVGTYHVANGQLLGLGTWRASAGRVVAVSCGGSWICSVTRRD